MRPQPVHRVISEATARTFLEMMRATVETGSGTNAAIPGYSVGGKTGTAQVAEGGVYTEKRIASFVGVAPIDDPRLVGLVVAVRLEAAPRLRRRARGAGVAGHRRGGVGTAGRTARTRNRRMRAGRRTRCGCPTCKTCRCTEAEAVLRGGGSGARRRRASARTCWTRSPVPGVAVPAGTSGGAGLLGSAGSLAGRNDGARRPRPDAAAGRGDVGRCGARAGYRRARAWPYVQEPPPGETVLRGTRVRVRFEPSE